MDLYTTQLYKDGYYSGTDDSDVLDITVKGKHRIGQHFAPTWKIVMGHKKDIISDAEYTEEYHDLMIASYYAHNWAWQWVLSQPRVVLACFCPAGVFCHRNVLVEYLVKLGANYRGEL